MTDGVAAHNSREYRDAVRPATHVTDATAGPGVRPLGCAPVGVLGRPPAPDGSSGLAPEALRIPFSDHVNGVAATLTSVTHCGSRGDGRKYCNRASERPTSNGQARQTPGSLTLVRQPRELRVHAISAIRH